METLPDFWANYDQSAGPSLECGLIRETNFLKLALVRVGEFIVVYLDLGLVNLKNLAPLI